MPPHTGSISAVASCKRVGTRCFETALPRRGKPQRIFHGIAVKIFVAESPTGYRLVVLLFIVTL